MASRLIDSLWVASYGSQIASGSIRFFAPGTTTPVTVYQDDAATVVVTQPVTLDANGRTSVPVYAIAPMRAILYDSTGAQVVDIERIDGDRAELSALDNDNWDEADDVDEALTLIATSNGGTNGQFKATGSGSVERSIQEKLSERPSVLDFQADPTGVSDSFAAFTSGIAAVSAAGGGTLEVPPGSYLTSQVITLLDGVSLRGASATSSIIVNASASGNCITATLGIKRFFIEDIGISAATASTGVGIYLNGNAYVTLSRVRVTGHRICVDTTDAGSSLAANQYHRILNCELINDANAAGRCVRMAGTVAVNGNSGNHMLLGNILSGSGGVAATLIEIAGLSSNISIFGNVSVPDNQAVGVLITAGHTGTGIYIVGNDFSNMTTTGLNIARATGPTLMDYGNRWGGGIVDASDGAGNYFAGQYTSIVPMRPAGSGYYSQTIAITSSAVVNFARGNFIHINATGGGTTITIPQANSGASMPAGSTLTLSCQNASGGAVTWTFDGLYVLSAAVAPASGARVLVTFRSIGGANWHEISRVTI